MSERKLTLDEIGQLNTIQGLPTARVIPPGVKGKPDAEDTSRPRAKYNATLGQWENPKGDAQYLPKSGDKYAVVIGYVKEKFAFADGLKAQDEALAHARKLHEKGAIHVSMYYCGDKGGNGEAEAAKARANELEIKLAKAMDTIMAQSAQMAELTAQIAELTKAMNKRDVA